MVWGSGDFHKIGRQKVALARQLAGFKMPAVICDVDTVSVAQGFAGGTLSGGSWQAMVSSWSSGTGAHGPLLRCLVTAPTWGQLAWNLRCMWPSV